MDNWNNFFGETAPTITANGMKPLSTELITCTLTYSRNGLLVVSDFCWAGLKSWWHDQSIQLLILSDPEFHLPIIIIIFVSRRSTANGANELIGFGLLVAWLTTTATAAITPCLSLSFFLSFLSHRFSICDIFLSSCPLCLSLCLLCTSISACCFSGAWWSSLVAAWRRSCGNT